MLKTQDIHVRAPLLILSIVVSGVAGARVRSNSPRGILRGCLRPVEEIAQSGVT